MGSLVLVRLVIGSFLFNRFIKLVVAMKKYSQILISILFIISVILLSGCGTAEAPAPEEATPTPEFFGSSSENREDPAQDEEPAADEAPVEEDQDEVGQACLIGTWQTVPGSVSGYLSEAMNSTSDGGITFGVENEQGYLTLKYDEAGQVEGLAEEYQVTVTIAEIDTAIDVVMVLSGSAEYTADDSTLTIIDPNYDAEAIGEGLVAGMQTDEQVARIELTPGSFAAQSGPIAIEAEPESEGSGEYSCEGDTLIIEITDLSTIEWERVE